MANCERISTMLTTGEVARLFGVNVSTVRRWSSQGILRGYRIGPRGDRRFRRDDVAVFYMERSIQRRLKGDARKHLQGGIEKWRWNIQNQRR